jgi:threonine 3-dehydrogenase
VPTGHPAQARFDLSVQIPVRLLTTLGEELHRQKGNLVANGTMAALRKSRPAPGLELDTMSAVPGIGPRDVLVAVRYAGICGTDHHIFDWDEWSANRVPLGIVVGHEFTGTVAAVGEGVSQVTVGQRVSGEGHIGCGVCELCRTGRAHICERIDIIGIDRDGCFAEYVAMPDHNLWVLDERIPDLAAAIMDPLGNAMHAVSAAQVSGRNVLVTGSGVIGLASVAIAQSLGAARVIATDVDPHRLELARHFGADDVVLSSDPGWVAEVRGITAGEGPDVLIEMSGHPDALSGGFAALRNGGTAALLGLPKSAVPLDLSNDIIFKGATVLGINGRIVYDTWYAVERFLLSGQLDLDALVTDVLPLEKFEEAFALIANRTALKVIFEIGAR